MNSAIIVKIICLALVAMPATLTNVQGLTLTPAIMGALAVLAVVAGIVLSELDPLFGIKAKE